MRITITRDMNVEDEGSSRQFTKGEAFDVVATVEDREKQLSRGTADRLYRAGAAQMDNPNEGSVTGAASKAGADNFVGGPAHGTPANRPIEGGLATGRAQPESDEAKDDEGKDGEGEGGDDLETMSKAKLIAYAKANSIEIDERASKADVLAAIKTAEAA